MSAKQSVEHGVIQIKNRLKAKQLLSCFDDNLRRLNEVGLDPDESEVDTLERLSDCLEEAIENGMEIETLQSRASALADYALSHGYAQHEVESLLTMRPNPNGKRLRND